MGNGIKLSDGEKLILWMLCDIQQHLKMQTESYADFVKEAISTGNSWALSMELPGILHGSEASETVVKETTDILVMWEILEDSFERLSQPERDSLGLEFKPFGPNLKFAGFSGNYDSEYLSVARFYIHKTERFQRFKDRDLDSHAPMIEAYRRMLNVFQPFFGAGDGAHLTVDEIAAVAAERVHPSKRVRS
jgi:uncharacterized protein YfbU (UPF0304 family)